MAEALRVFAETRPDAVVTDLQLPDGTGLDIVRAVRRESADTGLVILTMHSGDEQIFAAMEAGASAFVGKDAPSAEVVQAARHAAASPRSFMSTGLVGAVMRRSDTSSTRLSDREMEVLVLLADGLGTSAIASRLYMSESTVKSHIAQIYTKMGASNRAQALVTAMRRGLLSTHRPARARDGVSDGSAARAGVVTNDYPGKTGILIRGRSKSATLVEEGEPTLAA